MTDLISNHDQDPLDELIAGYFETELSDEQMTALNARLRADAGGRRQFVATAITLQAYGASRRVAREKVIEDELATMSVMGLVVDDPDEPTPAPDDEFLSALKIIASGEAVANSKPQPSSGGAAWMHRKALHWAAAALVLIAVSLAIALRWTKSGEAGGTSPAILARATDAAWGDRTPVIGAPLPVGTKLSLTSGYAELTFASGATVVVEAPAEFKLASAGAMSLLSGKLSATVPPPAHGFTVTTPSASVTDLGTEFGVVVSAEDQTRVEVFVGKVRASDRADAGGAQAASAGQLLVAGQAAVVSGTAVTLDPAGSSPQRFVHSLADNVTSLDLVDLFSGGDGTTGRRGAGIDQTTGNLASVFVAGKRPDSAYHRTFGRPVIDGCFVPDGRSGPMAIDSIDDRFLFPATSGLTDYNIWAGGEIAMPSKEFIRVSSRLGTVDYSQAGHDLIFIHANGGVTFDLDAIRKIHPGLRIASFQFTAGNSYGIKGGHSQADLLVIVNGTARFVRHKLKHAEGPVPADVPLYDGDRFMTLAVTDGGEGINGDWILFGDPRLEVTTGSQIGVDKK